MSIPEMQFRADPTDITDYAWKLATSINEFEHERGLRSRRVGERIGIISGFCHLITMCWYRIVFKRKVNLLLICFEQHNVSVSHLRDQNRSPKTPHNLHLISVDLHELAQNLKIKRNVR